MAVLGSMTPAQLRRAQLGKNNYFPAALESACSEESAVDHDWPSELNTTKATHMLKVHKDKLTLTYTGKGNHTKDVGAIQTNLPFSNKRLVGYYEIIVRNAGAKGCIAIGLADESFSLDRQPGWEANSYGYHGEDGRKFSNSSRGEGYGPSYVTRDVVGCGINFAKNEIFFTKNGQYLGVAFTGVGEAYFPTVGLHSPDEEVTVNLGGMPFAFDIQGLIAEEQMQTQQAIAAIPMPVSDMNLIVRDYLRHYGHQSALKSFEDVCGLPDSSSSPRLKLRKEIRALILAGDLTSAIAAAEQAYPGMMSRHIKSNVYLQCQQFIEHLRTPASLPQVLQLVQGPLRELMAVAADSHDDSLLPYLQDVLGLLAYADPSQSPVGRLLQPTHRQVVADVVNEALLAEAGLGLQSKLESLIQQLMAVQRACRDDPGGQPETFKLRGV